MHCLPEARLLALWGERHRLLRMKQETGYQQNDAGYALHALLRTAFGSLAPKPFWYRGAREGLLAFTTHDPESLRQNAALAPPEVAAVLGLDAGVGTSGLIFRRYPTIWETGYQLNFEVRMRPVVRVRDGAERDVFQLQAEKQPTGAAMLTRASVYSEWLRQQLLRHEAAKLVTADLTQFRLTSVLRQTVPQADGSRTRGLVTGPEAVLIGRLEVDNPGAFSSLLARGIGRHRAFGFGLLLLRPSA
jgi:CRISPR system Cascade subunit CasE